MILTMAKRSGKIPESALGRTGRLLWSGARIAMQEVGGRIASSVATSIGQAAPEGLATKIKQTQELVKTLSELKGAAMKAGQLLSLELSDLLPKEMLDILRQLHDEGTSMAPDQVEAILKLELGSRRKDLKDLTPEPIAAASIGQVHQATLHGRAVAIKIQYPGVAGSIDSDLKILKKTANMVLSLQRKEINLNSMFAELARGLKREANYLHEADNLELYRKTMHQTSYLVPEVFRDFTTARVLTMSFEDGDRLSSWVASHPDEKAVKTFGKLIVDLIFEEFFTNGLVQTDPNYGNFLYRPMTKQLVLLDFGATQSYELKFRDDIRQILGAVLKRDSKQVLEFSHQLGFLDRRESEEAQHLYMDLMRLIGDPFRVENQPFSFADGDFIKELRAATFRFVQKVQYSPPARQLLFLNRKLAGMFHLLKDVGFEMDLSSHADKIMNTKT